MARHIGPARDVTPEEFLVSAPGKIILFGEHAVVYGKLAIAAPIGLRSFLYVESLSEGEHQVNLQFYDIGLDHAWNISDLPWSIAFGVRYRRSKKSLTTTIIPELMAALEPLIATISPSRSEATKRVHRTAASTFLYMFMLLGNPYSPACSYHLRSTIPVGAGLGSSASIAVCFSAALLTQFNQLGIPDQCSDDIDIMYSLGNINEWALLGEICMHGKPSGIDNMVTTLGKVISFRKDCESGTLNVDALDHFPELPILVANSMQSRSTAIEVKRVRETLKREPQATQTILDAIDRITSLALHKITTHTDSVTSPNDGSFVQQLGQLMHMNHGLLVALGVSHPKLEHIRKIVDGTGHAFTKLTGAGGGGCTVSLLDHPNGGKECNAIEESLRKNGYEAHATALSRDGVGFCSLDEFVGKKFEKAAFVRGGEVSDLERAALYCPSSPANVWQFWDSKYIKGA